MRNEKRNFIKIVTRVSFFALVMLFCFGSAYGDYGVATHSTTQWQELGIGTGADADDYGVFWSTDNGTTWGNDNVFVGDIVSFKFSMHKDNKGTHYADHLKVWLDQDNSKSFDDEHDQIIYREELLTGSGAGDTFTYDPSKGYAYSFKVTDEFLTDGLFLRARVACSESLLDTYYKGLKRSERNKLNKDFNDAGINLSSNAPNQWNWLAYKNKIGTWYESYEDMFKATGNYWQGEVEEWNIRVSKKTSTSTGNPVPEPATMILFGCGLLGLARFGRKRNQM